MAQRIQDIALGAPPAAVSGLVLVGIEMQDVVLVLTAIYTVVMIVKNLPPACKAIRSMWKTLKEKLGK